MKQLRLLGLNDEVCGFLQHVHPTKNANQQDHCDQKQQGHDHKDVIDAVEAVLHFVVNVYGVCVVFVHGFYFQRGD